VALDVCIPRPPRGGFLDELSRRIDGDVRLHAGSSTSCDVLVEGRPAREQLAPAPRAVIVPYAGVPAATVALLRDFPGVTLHNLHHNAAPTAETALALLLAAAKRVVPLDRALREDDWRPRYGEPTEALLAGGTAVVLGYGAVGRRVAAACRALGMDVAAVRRKAGAERGVHGVDALPDLLPRATAVVVCLPLTPETRGLLGADELALLPGGAILVNVGRADIVDEDALFEELRSGRIAAGLDVWYRYPEGEEGRAATPPAGRPFGTLDNVVLSPHHAGSCRGIEELRALHLADLLNAAARGKPMPNRVDPERGY